MKLNHIGLNIQGREDVVDFYQNILGFHFEHQFELFVYSENTMRGFAHICLEVKDHDKTVGKSVNEGYTVTRIQRNDKLDLLFVKDKGENVLKLKNKNNEDLS